MVGDKGYKTKLFEWFYENKLHILTRPRKNMKKLPVENKYNIMLNKRGCIESVFDILSSICDIEHTRHRSPTNAFVNIFAALAAYQHMDRKPAFFAKKNNRLAA